MSHRASVALLGLRLLLAAGAAFVLGFAVRVGAAALWSASLPRWRDVDDGLLLLAVGWCLVIPLFAIAQDRTESLSLARSRTIRASAMCALLGVLSTSPTLHMFGARVWSEDLAWILAQGA